MTETYLTLTEAAEATDRSRVTLRRYLDQGRFPNARRDEDDVNRQWLIPLSDLEAAGVRVHMGQPHDTGHTTPLAVRVAVAEAVAAERGAALEHVSALAEALRAQAEAVTALLSALPSPPKD